MHQHKLESKELQPYQFLLHEWSRNDFTPKLSLVLGRKKDFKDEGEFDTTKEQNTQDPVWGGVRVLVNISSTLVWEE